MWHLRRLKNILIKECAPSVRLISKVKTIRPISSVQRGKRVQMEIRWPYAVPKTLVPSLSGNWRCFPNFNMVLTTSLIWHYVNRLHLIGSHQVFVHPTNLVGNLLFHYWRPCHPVRRAVTFEWQIVSGIDSVITQVPMSFLWFNSEGVVHYCSYHVP